MSINRAFSILTKPITPEGEQWDSMGHHAVTRSLLDGLKKIGYVDYNFQPSNEDELFEHVHVLYGPGKVGTMQYAMELYEKGKITRITAGPNVFDYPYDPTVGLSLNDQRIEKYLVPSEWYKNLFAYGCPECAEKLNVWPAGVTSDLLMEPIDRTQKIAVLYVKRKMDEGFYLSIANELESAGYEVKSFVYGNYRYQDYIETLKKASFMIAVAETETQGLYLAEAWGLDVPTICYSPDEYEILLPLSETEGVNITTSGNLSCPYLSEDTGVCFSKLEDLRMYIKHIDYILDNTSPRKWVIDNMTDEICARNFLSIVNC